MINAVAGVDVSTKKIAIVILYPGDKYLVHEIISKEKTVNDRFIDTKVLPSPFIVEVTKMTFPNGCVGNINFILVIKILKASDIGERSFGCTNSPCPFCTVGTSPNTETVEINSRSCLDRILSFKSSLR